MPATLASMLISWTSDVAYIKRWSPVRIRPSPSFFCESATLEPFIETFSDTRIVAKKQHNKDKKLHNSDEKLHNSHGPDLAWQEMTDQKSPDYHKSKV